MNGAGIWAGFLSLADYSHCILRNVTEVTKDGSDISAHHHLGIFDNFEFLRSQPPKRMNAGSSRQTRPCLRFQVQPLALL
jgi:hypothetical protein